MRTHGPIKEKLRARLEKSALSDLERYPGEHSSIGPVPDLPETVFSLTGEDILSALPSLVQMQAPIEMSDWVAQLVAKTMASFQPQNTMYALPASVPNAISEQPEEMADVEIPSHSDYVFKPFSFSSKPVASASIPPADALQSTITSPMVTKWGDLSYDKPTCSVDLDPDDGGPMVDLSGYQDLTRPPVTGDASALATDSYSDTFTAPVETPIMTTPASMFKTAAHPEMMEGEYKVEYSGNVKTLVQLVSDLPDGVTKQTGAQIIRLTMEAMGISMENVLSEAQTAQSELLDAARSNIKKIEEYKTIIRKLETESRFHQGKANELSEIIDLFILSNTLPNNPMDAGNMG